MDQELLIKVGTLIATVIVSALTTWKIVSELLRNQKERLREEYKFARDFLSELKAGNVHPYLAQLGYQAIAGDAKADSDEIEHLLTLQKPRTAVQAYLLGKTHLSYFSTSNPPGFVFTGKNVSDARRKLLKYWYAFAYFVTYSLAVSPLIMVSLKLLSFSVGMPIFVLSSLLFIPLVFLSLKSVTKLARAETVIKLQEQSRKALSRIKVA